ncbi:acyltransferase family protein [Robinsoniella peoriensis]|uniref:acyltransferase family protein n=1 Tax=Robinsoniella peoriensis TaxID=180332 RepID=UPI00374FE5B7
MTEENSKKITFMNYTLIALIVLLHCDNRTTSDYNFVVTSEGDFVINIVYNIFGKLCETAVPTFYALSGYLFFRNCTDENLTIKCKKRFKTVMIPYLFWNGIFYIVYFIMSGIPLIASRINMNIPSLSLYSVVFQNFANPPLWFLRKLFYLQMLSPIVYFLFKKIGKYSGGVLVVLAAVDVVVQFGYSNTFHWFPVYFGAGFLAMFYKKVVEEKWQLWMQENKCKIFLIVALLIIAELVVGRIQWLIAPLLWWGVLGCISKIPYMPFMKASFFVFCTHYFTILIVRKVLVLLLGTLPIMMLTTYLLSFIIVLIFTTSTGIILKKVNPKTYGAVCGGR